MLPMAEKGDTKMSLDKILMDDRLTLEQRNAMISMLEKAGEGFIDLVTTEAPPCREGDVEAEVEDDEVTIDVYPILDVFLPKEIDGSSEISGFVDKILLGSESDGGNNRMKKYIKFFDKKGVDFSNEPLGFALEYAHLYFAIGYILGQIFDIYPGNDDREEALKTVEVLKKELKQAGVLPFWPRNLTPNTPTL